MGPTQILAQRICEEYPSYLRQRHNISLRDVLDQLQALQSTLYPSFTLKYLWQQEKPNFLHFGAAISLNRIFSFPEPGLN